MPNIVWAKNAEGWNMSVAQFLGSGPKWTITCGNCEGTFQKRIPMVDYPGILCPYCGTTNKINIVVT